MVKFKGIKLTVREKSLLNILIAEIKSCKDLEEIRAIVDSWVTANDLHPEKVLSITTEEFQQRIQRGDYGH
jgi:hypothetical protein